MNYTPYGTIPILDKLVQSPYPQTRQEVAEQGYGLDVLANDEDKGVLLAVAENCNNDADILSRVYNHYDEDLRLALAQRASGDLLDKMCTSGSYNVRITANIHKLELLDADNSALNSIEYAEQRGTLVGEIYSLKTQYLNKVCEHIEHIENRQSGVYGTKEYPALLEEKAELFRTEKGLLESLSADYRFYNEPEFVSATLQEHPSETRFDKEYIIRFNVGHITNDDLLSVEICASTLNFTNEILTDVSDFNYRKMGGKTFCSIMIDDDYIPEKVISDCLSRAMEKVIQQEYEVGSPIYNKSPDRNFVDEIGNRYPDFYDKSKKDFLAAHKEISIPLYDETANTVYNIPSLSLIKDDIVNCCTAFAPELHNGTVHFFRDNVNGSPKEYTAGLEYGLMRMNMRMETDDVIADVFVGRQGDASGKTVIPRGECYLTSITLTEQNGNYDTAENRAEISRCFNNGYIKNELHQVYDEENAIKSERDRSSTKETQERD